MVGGELVGKVCLVTGASRGIGRGIALQLGKAGATVYITGRTLNPTDEGVRGSLKETAKEVEDCGGICIPVQCDHSDDDHVSKLFDRIAKEQNGRLDLLVNNAYAGVTTVANSIGKPFWELPSSVWDQNNNVGLRSHYMASWHAAQMMVPAKQGLIINISSVGGLRYFLNVAYGVGKAASDRLAVDCAIELRKHNVAYISMWPGAVKTELLVDMVPSAKNTALAAAVKAGESVEFSGKAVVHLTRDPHIMKKSGRILLTMELAEEYGFLDIDGRLPPNWRQAKALFARAGHTWVAAVTPGFIKIPFWLLAVLTSNF